MSEPYDIFISHASEDKAAFVRPLAVLLSRLGLRVWFDELSLDVGDSLSRSIDRGLTSSRFGVVVLSPAFFSKAWPEYELRGLTTREIDGTARILPIWSGVTRADVAQYSPTLADRVAISADLPVEQVAGRLLKVVRPELHNAIGRWIRWQELRTSAPTERVALESIKLGPIRHKALPRPLLVRIFLIEATLREVSGMSLEKAIESFQRDLHPHEEVERWEHIAAAFVAARSDPRLSAVEPSEVFMHLLGISFRRPEDAIDWLSTLADEQHVSAIVDAYAGVVATLESKLAPMDPNI